VATYRCVLKASCGRLVSAAWSSWTLEFYSSLPFSSASGPPKCDVSHLVDPPSALCSSASVTLRYLVTHRHNIPLPRCQDPSGDLLHDMCDSRDTKVQWVQWFNGASQRKQATRVQWYSGSVGCRGVSERPVVQWFNGVCVMTCYSTRRKASRCKRNQARAM
jgi:hypothetical protein